MAERNAEHGLLREELGRVLAEYVPGTIPVVNAPNNPNVLSILHHEQCHKGLIFRTLYGYLLKRLFDLTNDKRMEADTVALFTPIRDDILAMAWGTLEGQATTCELIYHQLRTQTEEFFAPAATLNDTYKGAVGGFISCLAAVDNNLVRGHILVSAVAEYSMDRPLLDVFVPGRQSFVQWITDLANGGIGPDHFVLETVEGLKSLPISDIFGDFTGYENTADNAARELEIRENIKRALYARDPGDGRSLLGDDLHRLRTAIDDDLTRNRTKSPLEPFEALENDVLVMRPPANEWYVDEIMLSPRDFFERFERELRSERWACVIVSGMPVGTKAELLPIVAHPLRRIQTDKGPALVLGDVFHSMVPPADFLVADTMMKSAAPEQTAWFNLGLPIDGKLFNIDHFNSLSTRTILHTPFSGLAVLQSMTKMIPEVASIEVIDLETFAGLEVVVINGDDLIVMYLAPKGHTAEITRGASEFDGIPLQRYVRSPGLDDLLFVGALQLLVKTDQPDWAK
jgi:hypothetical protein